MTSSFSVITMEVSLGREHEKTVNLGNIKKEGRERAGEMAQWLRAPTALPKFPSSNPSKHNVAHNHP